jgi:multicomponent Na+:H+ antiporter subunit E
MRTKIISLLSFFLIWLGLSGAKFDAINIAFLIIAPSLTFYIANKLSLIPAKISFKFFATIKYFFWLAREIIMSAIAVSKIAWRANLRIQPSISPIISIQTQEIGMVTYANSITLTPGTVSLSVQDDKILVHALDSGFMEDLQVGEMDRRIKAIFLL